MKESKQETLKLEFLLTLKSESDIYNVLKDFSIIELYAWSEKNDLPLRKNLSRVKALEELSRQIYNTGVFQRIASTK